MLSEATLKSLKHAIKTGSIACANPYKWVDPNRVQITSSRAHCAGFILTFTLMSFYEGFLICRAIQAFVTLDHSKHLGTIVNLCYNVAVYAIPVSMQVLLILRWNQIPALISGYIEFYEGFMGEKYNSVNGQFNLEKIADTVNYHMHSIANYVTSPKQKLKNGCEGILRAFEILAVVIVLQNVVLIIRAPHKSFFLTSLFTENKHLAWHVRLPLLIVHLLIWSNIAGHLLLKASLLYSYVYPAVFIAEEMIL